MLKKAQAAMEYLMTYGWAILIVIVVVAALYSMGVFSIKPSQPCSPCVSYFAYLDYADGTMKIRNGARGIESISVLADPDTGTAVAVDVTTADPGDTITITGIDTTGDVDIGIEYTVTASSLIHADNATIHNP